MESAKAATLAFSFVSIGVHSRFFEDTSGLYAKTFALLKTLPCDVFLGSHGSFFSLHAKSARRAEAGGVNPFIDPEGYRTFLETNECAFCEQLEREEKAAR